MEGVEVIYMIYEDILRYIECTRYIPRKMRADAHENVVAGPKKQLCVDKVCSRLSGRGSDSVSCSVSICRH